MYFFKNDGKRIDIKYLLDEKLFQILLFLTVKELSNSNWIGITTMKCTMYMYDVHQLYL